MTSDRFRARYFGETLIQDAPGFIARRADHCMFIHQLRVTIAVYRDVVKTTSFQNFTLIWMCSNPNN
jgi:hypothetical protein